MSEHNAAQPPISEVIRAEAERIALERGTSADTLPRSLWRVLPSEGHRGAFTEQEFARAAAAFASPERAIAWAREVYSMDSGAGLYFPEDLLSALSLLSGDLAARVRLVPDETEEEADARVTDFRLRLEKWRLAGSPEDAFPQRSDTL